jgi:hypothetical protein
MSLLDEISTRGAEIRERLRQLFHRHEHPGETKTFLLMAYVDIALEHHEAIWLLTESRLNGVCVRNGSLGVRCDAARLLD